MISYQACLTPLLAYNIPYLLKYKWYESCTFKYLLCVQYLHIGKYKRSMSSTHLSIKFRAQK